MNLQRNATLRPKHRVIGTADSRATDAARTKAPPTPRRSRRAYRAALVIILTIPVAILSQVVWANGASTLIHFGLAAGLGLLALSTLDFKTGGWSTRIGLASAGTFAFILLLQGLFELTQLDWLETVAYDVLGQTLEAVVMTGIVIWAVALLVSDTTGRTKAGTTRSFGYAVMAAVVSFEVATRVLWVTGGELPEILKALYILPLIWLALEGKKQTATA